MELKRKKKEKELVAIGSISSKVQVVEWYVLCNDNKHTSILGGSNGGLVMAAVANQRPDLFGAAIP